MSHRALRALSATLLFTSCYDGGEPLEGFVERADGEGPQIRWDLDAEPLPEIPLPNDIATRTDLDSPTGRRVNATLEADTSFERRLRGHMSHLDGWGTFAPIWLQFDALLDLVDIAERQRGDAAFDDDAVLLVDVTPGSPTYGEAQVLDFGNGSFPITIEDSAFFGKSNPYFENDPRAEASNLLFDTIDEDARGDGDGACDVWEDRNQNGTLDSGEDLDSDGHLDVAEDTDADGTCDVPNLWGTVVDAGVQIPHHPQHPGHPNHPYYDLISFFELESNTLTFRPVVPLRERTTYAVVLTTHLRGENGDPVRSPFAYAHHLQQLEPLAPLFEDGILSDLGLTPDQVAFAWTFTTQSVTADMVALREGLHGIGPFAHLAREYPPVVDQVVPIATGEGLEAHLLRPQKLIETLDLVFDQIDIAGFDASGVQPLLDTYGAVDYVVAGDYTSPDFLAATPDYKTNGRGVFDIDIKRGSGSHVPESLRFLLVVPKAAFGTAPFPVLLYCHGYTSLKLEALAFAGVMAKYGIATFVIDSYSHGIPLGDEVLSGLLEGLDNPDLQALFDAVKKDRARDLNDDGFVDPGGDFWTNDTFHTRDIVRQTAVDYLQAVRVLQAFDGVATWPIDLTADGTGTHIAGDFNNDGTVDVGGPGSDYFVAGTSMGGILSSIIGAIEPAIVAAAPVSPGGGLLEVGLRTDLGNVVRAVILPIMGPMVITQRHPQDDRLVLVQWLVNDVFRKAIVNIARVGDLEDGVLSNNMLPGDIVRVENLSNGVADEVVVDAELRIRAHIPADQGDDVVISVYRPDGVGEPIAEGSLVRADSTLVKRIDTWEFELSQFNGRQYLPGDPLVSIAEGLGFRRNTPSLRRLLGVAQTVLEPADPVNWAPHYSNPLDIRPEGRRVTNVLYSVTLGDMTVPVSTAIALARSAGVISYREPDPRWGVSQNQLLIDMHVTEGIDELHYFNHDCCRHDCGQENFDIDDLSDGRHRDDLPRLDEVHAYGDGPSCGDAFVPDCSEVSCAPMPPLRATVKNGAGVNAMRVPALSARGQHAIDLPNPNQPFDASMMVINQMGLFLSSRGTVISDHPCLATNDCRTCSGENDCPSIPPPTTMPALGQ